MTDIELHELWAKLNAAQSAATDLSLGIAQWDQAAVLGTPPLDPPLAPGKAIRHALAAMETALDELERLRVEVRRLAVFCKACSAAPGETCACPGRGV